MRDANRRIRALAHAAQAKAFEAFQVEPRADYSALARELLAIERKANAVLNGIQDLQALSGDWSDD